jgi:hypothetical protein
MEIVKDTITFGQTEGSGPQVQTKDVTFPGPVTKVTAVLTGFVAEYSEGDDHHLGKVDVFLDTSLLGGNVVRVTARFGLRDWSGDWDDKYDGRVDFAVIGE